jgi:hypothetical protein
MRDILFPVVVIAFFALATMLVTACDRLLEGARERERTAGSHPEPR